MKKKYYIALDEYERSIIINSLNEMRNRLIASGKYTDAVDEVLLKVIDAKQKKVQSDLQGGLIMEKKIYNEHTGISYTLQGDYYLPDLALPPEEEQPIGVWGQRHLRYIRQHKRLLYSNLLTSGKLNGYLADIDRQAEEMFSRLVKQMADREGITEKLKAKNQMLWVGRMNNIRNRATEMINADIIYI